MEKVFVIAETESGARELCAAARTLGDSVTLCVVGSSAVTGVADKCLHIEVPDNRIADDAYPSLIKAFDTEGAQIVLAENTVCTLSLAGRLAAAKKASAITGVIGFDGATATSLYFGGVGTRGAKPLGSPAVYVVSAGTFDGSAAYGTEVVEEIAFEAPANAVTKVRSEALPPADVDLAGADVIISCGRGFTAEDDLRLARDLAAKTGAEIACTRPLAEEAGWFSRELYLGVSGVTVSPKAVFAVGVSGQMQHMVGINGAGTIFAVNKDKNAPIFRLCDYGFVGDLKTVLPELTAVL